MQEVPKQRLLVLYGSQTGNAQDVAERVAREARLLLFNPAVMPMDAYPMQHLPEERFVVFVAATTGQVAAKKLDRRLQALGAAPLLERGLGDDQHPSGYEATLDPWLQQLWSTLRRQCPLPPGVKQPVLDEAAMLQLGPAKYNVTYLPVPPAHLQQQQQQQQLGSSGSGLDNGSGSAGSHQAPEQQQQQQQNEQQLIQQAVAAAAAFRAVAAEAAGMSPSTTSTTSAPPAAAAAAGPWRPFMAPLLVNRRVTSTGHFQDTRHIEFDLRGSGLEDYSPGDLLAVFPRTPATDVEAALTRLGLDGSAWVRIEAARASDAAADGVDGASANGSTDIDSQQQHQQQLGTAAPGSSLAVCEAPLRAILQGVLDLSGCSPRRYLFQVLSHFTPHELQQQRLQYFATAEGRDDLYRYNQRERRSLLEVLQDFPAASPPLERLLEAAPLLAPRMFSLASAPGAHPSRAAILMAVVRWNTPTKRLRQGLLTNWLAGLQPSVGRCASSTSSSSGGAVKEAAVGSGGGGDEAGGGGAVLQQQQQQQQQQQEVRVPVWVEQGCLRLPPSHSTPLILVGPGTGVAPFRSFLWQRAAIKLQQQQQQKDEQGGIAGSSCLFFGCRSPTDDFYYEEEWLRLLQLQVLQSPNGFQVAFSRHNPQPDQQQLLQMLQQAAAHHTMSSGIDAGSSSSSSVQSGSSGGSSSKVYVTHKLRDHGEMVWRLLSQQGAWVYVSGSAEKMPAGVVSALEDVVVEHGGLSKEAAARFVRQLELTGRYHVEAWS